MSALSTAYADCFSGVSGDMFLAALIHCGVDEMQLRADLSRLDLGGFSLIVGDHSIGGIGCKRLAVSTSRKQEKRGLHAIIHLLQSSSLSLTVIEKGIRVFTELAQAESKIHGCTVDEVHFHEVGALDSIIDIIGVLLGLEQLNVDKIYASPLPMGRGFVDCEHGRLPLPAPAVCEILQEVPVYGVELEKELVTPTGAALLKVLAEDYGPLPPMTITNTGYGAGSHTLENGQPNLFRLIIGQRQQVEECQEVEVIETNLDDWSPEGFAHLCDRLMTQGAVDVSIVPIHGKKGRPGFLLRVIADPVFSLSLKQTILSETTAIGLRFRKELRMTLPRESVSVSTPWGEIQAKKVQTPAGMVVYPEYDACREVARRFNIPLKLVYDQIKSVNINQADSR